MAKEKSNSLRERGYKVAPAEGQDEKGNPFVFEVTSPKGTSYFVKRLKDGKLRAVRQKTDKDTTTVAGMFSFVEAKHATHGLDLVGEPFKTERKQSKEATAPAAGAPADAAPAAENKPADEAA